MTDVKTETAGATELTAADFHCRLSPDAGVIFYSTVAEPDVLIGFPLDQVLIAVFLGEDVVGKISENMDNLETISVAEYNEFTRDYNEQNPDDVKPLYEEFTQVDPGTLEEVAIH